MSPFASLFVLGVVLLVAGWCCVLAIHAAPERDPEPSGLDILNGVGQVTTDAHRCRTTGPQGGHSYRGVGAAWVCLRCGDTVARVAPLPDRDLTHAEQRQVHDDARRITGESAGGGRA